MLSIYYKMAVVTSPQEPTCKARCARSLSHCQNAIILAYTLTYTVFLWTYHFLLEDAYPED